jgi:hypothetical protein
LQQAHDELEQTVADRMTELTKANGELAVFRRFVEASGQGFGMSSLDGYVAYVNPSMCRLFCCGYAGRYACIAANRDAFDPHGYFRPVSRVCLVESRRLVSPAVLQTLLLATQRVVEVAADDWGGQSRFPTELGMQFVENQGAQLATMGIVLVSPPRGPEYTRVLDWQIGRLMGKTIANSRIRMVFVTFPTPEYGTDDSHDARTIDLEIPMEGSQQEFTFLAVLDVRMPEIEHQLSVYIGRQKLGHTEERALGLIEKRNESATSHR